jgi:D-inositol-3-phosphate glycosyltransferase
VTIKQLPQPSDACAVGDERAGKEGNAASAPAHGRRLKIGLLTDNYPDSGGAGGIGTYSKIVAEELARIGHEVHVFTNASVSRLVRRSLNGITLWECPCWSKRREMPLVRAMEFTVRHKNRAELLNRYSLAVAVGNACKSSRFDVLESPEIGALGSLVATRRFTRRLAVRLHKPSNMPFAFGNGQGEGAWSDINEWERELAFKADVLTVATEYARREIGNFWNDPLRNARVIALPIAHRQPRHSSDGFDKRPPGHSAIFFGRLEPRKGVDTLALAIPFVRRYFPDFTVTFIGADNQWPGGGSGADVIRRIARESGAGESVRLLPPLPHHELMPVVRAADVCALPSRAETCGLVFLEAMMWGVPCVAGDIGPFRELARDGEHCFLVDPNDPGALADRICRLLADPQLAREMATNAYIHAGQWSAQRIVPRILDAWLSPPAKHAN